MLLITKDGTTETPTKPADTERVAFSSLALGMRFRTQQCTLIKVPPFGENNYNAIGMRGLGWNIPLDQLVLPMGQVWHIQEVK